MIDLVVIGGGTAGLTAAIYAGRAGLNTVVIEESVYGGQIAYSAEVENFPAIKKTEGWEFATKLYEQAEALGAQLKYETVVSVDLSGKAKKVVTNKLIMLFIELVICMLHVDKLILSFPVDCAGLYVYAIISPNSNVF